MKKIAIIGAGASGLLCAIECAKNALHVDIYEQNNKVGKKILVSGNGRCNISNTTLHVEDYFSQNSSFVAYAIKNFSFKDFEKYINSLGLLLETLEDGRAYPLSNEAKSVVHILKRAAEYHGVNCIFEQKIENLKELLEDYDAVVIATGSEAAPQLGGNASGYALAQECGHTIIPTYPALVQFELASPLPASMAGVKLEAEVTLHVNGIKEHTIQGDILFTNYGISGFCILDLSLYAAPALRDYSAVDISLNLLPTFTQQKLAAYLQKTLQNHPQLTLKDTLLGILPQKIVTTLLQTLALDETLTTLPTKTAKKIANTLVNWKFEVSQTHGFKHAEVSGGGIDTTEINPKTFCSSKNNRLYCIGEVLDVVGKRGGYNFAFAWASGYLAAQDIIQTNHDKMT